MPYSGDDVLECGADFVVHDLDCDFVAVVCDALHDRFVGGDAVLVLFCLKWGGKDDVAVAVVRDHDVLVSAACTDGEAPCVVRVQFVDGTDVDVEFVGRG